MKIGVLALQGAFIEHTTALQRLGVEAAEVRLPDQLDGLDGLIIPGGESTTIGKLAVDLWSDGTAARLRAGSGPSGAPAPGQFSSPKTPTAPSRCSG